MKYSNEEKLSIISRYQQGESIATLSDELNIPRSTLYRWLNSFPTDSAGKPLKFSYQEYVLLQRNVEKLQNIITILKSVDCLVSAPLKERLHALEPFYGKYEVHTRLCRHFWPSALSRLIQTVPRPYALAGPGHCPLFGGVVIV